MLTFVLSIFVTPALAQESGLPTVDDPLSTLENYAYIPNSWDASVSKVNVAAGVEVARYLTEPSDPTIDVRAWRTNRIAIDAEGNAWALNTGADAYLYGPTGGLQGSVVRIQFDTSGFTNTSNSAVPLDFGVEEAVKLFEIGAVNDMPRAIVIDNSGYIWIGFYKGGQLCKYSYDAAVGELNLVKTYSPSEGTHINYYDMKICPVTGDIFISSRSSTPEVKGNYGCWRFDVDTEEFKLEYGINSPYSLFIAEDGTVYMTAYSSNLYVRTLGVWSVIPIPNSAQLRGMAFDRNGVLWMASSGNGRIISYEQGEPQRIVSVGSTPVGVGRDANGYMWSITRDSNMIQRFDPTKTGTDPVVDWVVRVGRHPYAYGDFVAPPLLASLGDYVWGDLNRDGIQDEDEPGIPGVLVELYACGGTTPLANTQTDDDGYYLFAGLDAGSYFVKFHLPAGYLFTLQNQGTDDELDSDADWATGETHCVTLAGGDQDLSLDAGIYETGCLKITKEFTDYPEGYELPTVTGKIVGTEYGDEHSFELNEDNGWSQTICGLYPGVYTAYEDEVSGWITSYPAGPTVTVVAGKTAEVVILNSKTRVCETAWAFGGDDFANPNWNIVESKNWGWINGPLQAGNYTFDLYAGAGQNDLTKGTLVGEVNVDYEDDEVTVTYEMYDGYWITEAHLWIGDTPLPLVGKKQTYTSAPGQFPYGPSISADEKTATYTLEGVNGEIYVSAHGVVCWYP